MTAGSMWETGHLAITIIDMIFILALLTFFLCYIYEQGKEADEKVCSNVG